MKELYTKPVVSVEEFESVDVLTASNPKVDNVGGVIDD